MNRQQRAAIAQETLTILQQGRYQTPNRGLVTLQAALALACQQTVLYQPEAYKTLVAQLVDQPTALSSVISVSQQTTLAAAKALVQEYPSIACLNFASAKHPGGGFLTGSQAQEESLARASGLYATLQTKPEFYAYHKRLGTSFYSDQVIFSPTVPVFRDDADFLLDHPWQTSFLTAAAVNAGAVRKNEPERQAQIGPIMAQRIRMVLAVAATQQCQALVVGAWGCGVFQNDPPTIATLFAKVLAEPPFHNRFQHVAFAIYDTTPQQSILAPFQAVFP